MAFPQASGLLPTEVAFLCEMEQVTIVPRQRLDRLDLLGVSKSTTVLFDCLLSRPLLWRNEMLGL